MNETREHREGAAPTRLPWLMAPWLQPFWYSYLAFCWWQAGVGEATRAGTASAASAAALVPAGKLAGALTEAAFYHLWWRGRGSRLAYWRLFLVVSSASLADVFAADLAARASAAGPAARGFLAALAGPHALGDSVLGSPAARALLGSLGLLTVLRIAVTADAQARGAGVRFRAALGWTALVWLLGRLSMWWITDLARGRSPLPLGR